GLARHFADRIPDGLFDAAPVEQSALDVLLDREQIGANKSVVYLLKSGWTAAEAATGAAKGIPADARFRHDARHGDAAHDARFDLGGSRWERYVKRLDSFDADRLRLRRHGLDRRKEAAQGASTGRHA